MHVRSVQGVWVFRGDSWGFGALRAYFGNPRRQPDFDPGILESIERFDLGSCVVPFVGPGSPVRSNAGGYRRIWFEGRWVMLHRLIYALSFGKLDKRYEVDHLCGNPECCNPNHLEAVLPKENKRRAPGNPSTINSKKTHCTQGHALEGDNLRFEGGHRRCKACKRDVDRKRRKKK